MIYAISDLHGADDVFIKFLKQIKFSDKDELYILGDICDRGPNPMNIFKYIMDKPNIHFILGNHEDMFLSSYYMNFTTYAYETRLWLSNGGETTLKQFLTLTDSEKEKIIKYIEEAPLSYEINVDGKDFILVHGSYSEDNNRHDILWGRTYSFHKIPENKTLIFGHTTTRHYNDCRPMKIWKPAKGHMIGIDCGLASSDKTYGQLGCLCLNDLSEHYKLRK